MTRLAIAILVSLLLTLYAEQASADGRRVALVIGIGAYQTVPQLPNAVNDATAIAEMFRTAGFDVVAARTDVGNLELKRAIRDFEDAAADSDIAVVFYAGHGIQIQRTSYLIPADAKLINERDADDEAISLDRIITALEPAKRLRLVILDACRDNPFGAKMKRRVASRAISAGLGRVEPGQTDTLIAYAAAEGFVANDGDSAHSPFTTALLASLTVPGLDVRLAFGRVRDEVMKATGRKQEPYVYGSLGGGTVALVPAKAEAAPAALADSARSDYEIVERVGKKEAWEVFLNTHKTGMYADLARVQVAKLSPATYAAITPVAVDGSGTPAAAARTTPRIDPPPVEPAPKPAAAEQRAWDRLRLSTDQGAIRKFIDTYPNSLLLPDAQDRLETLQRLVRERDEAARLEREAARQREEDAQQKKAAELERKRLDREAAKQREEAERAKAAEAARQKAEAMAAAKQREAEERARAAEVAAHKREEEEAARLAAVAERRREAEQRSQALAAERAKADAEAAARKREAEVAARAAEAAKAAREAEERSRAQAAAEQARTERATAAQAEAIAKAAAKAEAQAAADARAAEERDRAKAAEIAARQKEAEARSQAAEAARKKAESETVATDREDAEGARIAEAARKKAKDEAAAERRRAQAAAEAAAERQAERAAAARRREAADNAREAAEEAAAANRRRAAEATRRAADRQAERASAAAEQRRRAAQQAKEASRAKASQPRAAQVRAAPAPRARAEARVYSPAPRASGGGGGGGGSAPMVGIGF